MVMADITGPGGARLNMVSKLLVDLNKPCMIPTRLYQIPAHTAGSS